MNRKQVTSLLMAGVMTLACAQYAAADEISKKSSLMVEESFMEDMIDEDLLPTEDDDNALLYEATEDTEMADSIALIKEVLFGDEFFTDEEVLEDEAVLEDDDAEETTDTDDELLEEDVLTDEEDGELTEGSLLSSRDSGGIWGEANKRSIREEIVEFATQYVGNPYVWGGTSLTNGADCSGFVLSVFDHFGYKLPRVAADQYAASTKKDLSALEEGDLVFYGGGIQHVAIYIGGGQIVHAANSRSGIIISDINYWTPVAGGTYLDS